MSEFFSLGECLTSEILHPFSLVQCLTSEILRRFFATQPVGSVDFVL
nr:hypothetical protein [uncultured Campylobacter sp.]